MPVGVDTDVNAAALGEATYGAGKGLDSLVYYTIGTGVGGGALVDGKLLHGLVHPEMGHMLLRRTRATRRRTAFARITTAASRGWPTARPSRALGNLGEGAAGGSRRVGRRGRISRADVRQHDSRPLAEADRAGRWGHAPAAPVPRIRRRTLELLNGYVAHPSVLEKIDGMIVPPGLGDNAGAVGSLLLAAKALEG